MISITVIIIIVLVHVGVNVYLYNVCVLLQAEVPDVCSTLD